MLNSACVLEKNTWDIDIQTDHVISVTASEAKIQRRYSICNSNVAKQL